MSLMEAAAYGRALIATNVPGCREIVIEGETGLLVAVEDPAGLADAIVALAQSPELRKRCAQSARRLVKDKLSARIVGKAVLAMYDRLLLHGGRQQ